MPKVRKEFKAYSLSIKDEEAIYELYTREKARVVSSSYKKYGHVKVYNEKIMDKLLTLSKEQVMTQARLFASEGLYGKRLFKAVSGIIRSSYKYSTKQNEALLNNINNLIKDVWSKAAGRSVRGRKSIEYNFDYTNLSSVEEDFMRALVSMRGDNLDVNEYLIDITDVAGQSYYFCMLYDLILKYFYSGDGDMLYES